VASQQDIKRRIRSVKNTRKITKAMELVAAAKLRRAEQRISVLRPYAERMRELIAALRAGEIPAPSRGTAPADFRHASRILAGAEEPS